DETFVPAAQVKLPEAGRFEEWKKKLLKETRVKCFKAHPEKIPPAEIARPIINVELPPTLATEPGIEVAFHVLEPRDSKTISLFALNSEAEESAAWIKEQVRGTTGLAILVRGVAQKWTLKSPP